MNLLSLGNSPPPRIRGKIRLFAGRADVGARSVRQTASGPGSAWSDWTRTGARFPNDRIITVGYLPDGRMIVFCTGDDGQVHSRWKVRAGSGLEWSDRECPGGDTADTAVLTAYLPDKRLHLFTAGRDGNLCTRIGRPGTDHLNSVPAGYLPGGRLQLLVTDSGGVACTRYQAADGPERLRSDWQVLGGKSVPVECISDVGYYTDGSMQVVAPAVEQSRYPLGDARRGRHVADLAGRLGADRRGFPNGAQVGYSP